VSRQFDRIGHGQTRVTVPARRATPIARMATR
jgi:hypothetical protein